MQILLQQPLRLFTIVTLLVMMSAEGLASCGDWLADSDESMQSHDGERQTDIAGESSVPKTPFCNGPQCRGPEPVAPVRSIPIDLRLQQEESAQRTLLSTDSGLNRFGSNWRHENESAICGFLEEVDRPPQVLA